MTKFSENYDNKPKKKIKKVVQVVTNNAEENNTEDNNYDELIKECVKEALKKDNERPVQTSQGQRNGHQEPLIANNSKKKKNRNKGNKEGQNGPSNKDFPALPVPAPKPKPQQKSQKKPKVDKIDFLKTEEEKKADPKPISFKEIEENPFQLKAKKAQKKEKTETKKASKQDKDFPLLDGGSATSGSILGETNKKLEVEEKYGIVINKNKGKKRHGRR